MSRFVVCAVFPAVRTPRTGCLLRRSPSNAVRAGSSDALPRRHVSTTLSPRSAVSHDGGGTGVRIADDVRIVGSRCRALRRRHPRIGRIGLFLDVDGTLLDLAERPERVAAGRSLIADLAAAERGAGRGLALVSGRPVADLDRLFAPLRLRAAGVRHGEEIRRDPDGPLTARPILCPPRFWTS